MLYMDLDGAGAPLVDGLTDIDLIGAGVVAIGTVLALVPGALIGKQYVPLLVNP